MVFVGKYDNDEHPEINSFLAILSIRNKTVTREFLITIPFHNNSVWLHVVRNFKPGVDAIHLLFDGENLAEDESSVEVTVYWDGSKYVAPWAKGPDLFEQDRSAGGRPERQDAKKKAIK